MFGIFEMRKKFFNTLFGKIVILSEVMLPKGALRSRRISCIHKRSFDFVCPSFVGSNSAQDDSLRVCFVRTLVTLFFLIISISQLLAQPITIELNDPRAAQVHTDSVNWNEGWIELSGLSPGEQPDLDDLRVTSGKRIAEILSIDSVSWKFNSRLALSFVLDNSSSMFHAFDSLTVACDSIANTLPAGAIGQAVTFDDRYRDAMHLYTNRESIFIAQHEFTDTMGSLSKFWHYFDTIRTQLTPLYDAIAAAVTNITMRKEHRGTFKTRDSSRNDVLIVVTDGEDNASNTSIELLEKLLLSCHLRLYAINFRTEEDNRLEWLSRKTGGDYYTANLIADLRILLQTIGKSLSRQYHIRYRFPTLGPSPGH